MASPIFYQIVQTIISTKTQTQNHLRLFTKFVKTKKVHEDEKSENCDLHLFEPPRILLIKTITSSGNGVVKTFIPLS